jgi:hypothetical protein
MYLIWQKECILLKFNPMDRYVHLNLLNNMKKLLTLLLVGLSFLGYAQNFQLTDSKGNPYVDGQTISATITEDDLDFAGEYVIGIDVMNLSDNFLDVKTFRTNVALVDGMTAYVCFGICDDPSGGMLAMNYEIEGGSSATYFLHLSPNGNFGLCKFKIEFWSKENQNDIVTLLVDIDMLFVGVKEQNNTLASLSAYPNPAPEHSTIKVSYTLTDRNNMYRLAIRNCMGAQIMSIPLNSYENNISVDLSILASGIYFYTIESNNQIIIANKLIIR